MPQVETASSVFRQPTNLHRFGLLPSPLLYSFPFDSNSLQNESLTIDAFDLLKVIGKGSFGKVLTCFSNCDSTF
jgi:hypothetical protein